MRGRRTEPTEKKKKKKKRSGRRTNQQRRRRKKERETEKPTEKKKKKRKEEEEEAEEEEEVVASRRHPCFVIVFFLFSFFSVFFPYKWDFQCFGLVSIYRPKQLDFVGMRPVFFLIRNKGVICTGALTGTVYTGCIGRYGTELTSLKMNKILLCQWNLNVISLLASIDFEEIIEILFLHSLDRKSVV